MKSRNKRTCLLILAMLLLSLIPVPAGAINPQPEPPGVPGAISVFVDGSPLTMDVAPLIEQGRTLVPLRAIFEALGATVDWNEATRTVTGKKGATTIKLVVGLESAYVNDKPVTLDVPGRIINGRTLVPLRFVSESLGAGVAWDGAARRVTISTAGSPVVPGVTQETPGLPGFSNGTQPPLASGDLARLLPAYLKLSANDKRFDAAFIYQDKLLAKPLDKSMILSSLPQKLDYSPYLTLTGNQDGWGGCIGRSIVHTIDILKEMEHPYSPDFSFWYLHARQAQLLESGAPDSIVSKTLLENHGLSSEVTMPTDYDPAELIYDGQGNPVKWDYSAMPQPTAAVNTEAGLYRVKLFSDPVTPAVDGVKSLLCRYGPVIAGGPLPLLLGPNPPEGHCITIVGFDDSMDVFKCLNSWGDTWGPNGNGFFNMPYNQLTENFDWVRYFENCPSDRSATGHAYTARIRIRHQNERNDLTVKIGVDGKEPLVVWNRPNDEPKPHPYDNSKELFIDVPLPAYAPSNWPPGYYHRWYVEVTDGVKDNLTAQIKEITLARLYHNPGNLTVGKFQTETYVPEQTNITVPDGGSVKVHIPGANPAKPPLAPQIHSSYTLTIEPGQTSVLPGNPVTLQGKLTVSAIAGQSSPAAGREIRIYKYIGDSCVNKPGQWAMVIMATPVNAPPDAGKIFTGSDGTYTASLTPSAGRHIYAAALVDQNGKVLASSGEAVVNAGLSQLKLPQVELYQQFPETIPGPGPIME